MSDKMIHIAKDFSRFPFARYKRQSNTSGEQFREEVLVPALRQYDVVTVNLDGTEGYGSSWFDESFGKIVSLGYFTSDILTRKLKFISNEDPSYIAEIRQYITDAGVMRS